MQSKLQTIFCRCSNKQLFDQFSKSLDLLKKKIVKKIVLKIHIIEEIAITNKAY